jgi:hypothetical protein
MSNSNCYQCIYLSKRPGAGNYFIFKCSYWGIMSQQVLPQSAVINSIGKRCEFFVKKKDSASSEKNKKKSELYIYDEKDIDFTV